MLKTGFFIFYSEFFRKFDTELNRINMFNNVIGG